MNIKNVRLFSVTSPILGCHPFFEFLTYPYRMRIRYNDIYFEDAMNARYPQRRTTLSSAPNSYQSMGDVLTGRQKSSILVVDDHPQNVLVMTELLATRGYRIISAPHAAAAEIAIRHDPPDLILLDVIMPGKTGYELCRQLKDDPLTRLIPIVMNHRPERPRGPPSGNRSRSRRLSQQAHQPGRTLRARKLASQVERVHGRVGDGQIGDLHSRSQRGIARPLHRRPLRTLGTKRFRDGPPPQPRPGQHCGLAPRRLPP